METKPEIKTAETGVLSVVCHPTWGRYPKPLGQANDGKLGDEPADPCWVVRPWHSSLPAGQQPNTVGSPSFSRKEAVGLGDTHRLKTDAEGPGIG